VGDPNGGFWEGNGVTLVLLTPYYFCSGEGPDFLIKSGPDYLSNLDNQYNVIQIPGIALSWPPGDKKPRPNCLG